MQTRRAERERWVLKALHGALEADTASDHAERVLPHLARAFDANLISAYEVTERGLEGHVPKGIPDPYPVYCPVMHRDPYQALKLRLNPRVAIVSDAIEPKLLRRSQVVHEVYSLFDADRHLVVRTSKFSYGQVGCAAILLSRSRKQRPWQREDVADLERLMPLFVAVDQRNRSLRELTRDHRVLQDAAGALSGAESVLLFDRQARLAWVSPRAARELGIRVTDELPAVLMEAVVRVVALDDALEGAAAAKLEVRVPVGAGFVRASLFRYRSSATEERFVLVRFDARPGLGETAKAADRFGLSKCERGVLEQVSAGLSNAEIGKQLFVSVETVRTHLKHIYRKLGVHSRMQAALKVRGGEGV